MTRKYLAPWHEMHSISKYSELISATYCLLIKRTKMSWNLTHKICLFFPSKTKSIPLLQKAVVCKVYTINSWFDAGFQICKTSPLEIDGWRTVWLTYFWVFILFIYLFTKLKKKTLTSSQTDLLKLWISAWVVLFFFKVCFFIGTHFSNLNPEI